LCVSTGFSQSNAQTPIDHVYRAFFGHIVFLNARAEALAIGDPNRTSLSTYYQRILGLSSAENMLLSQVASAVDRSVATQDAKAEAIIRQIRIAYPAGRVSSKAAIPPRSAELDQLWQDRKAAILAQVQSLKAQLSPSSFAKVDEFVKTKFGSHVLTLASNPQGAAASVTTVGGQR
jgi:hypothetical protein